MLLNPRLQDSSDRKGGQLFRCRFRVPFPVFLDIVKKTRENHWFSGWEDAVGIKAAPLEFKFLAVLRVLGRGYCFDGAEEICFISAEIRGIFNPNYTFFRKNISPHIVVHLQRGRKWQVLQHFQPGWDFLVALEALILLESLLFPLLLKHLF